MKYAMRFWLFRHKIMNKPYVNTIILPEFLRKKLLATSARCILRKAK